MYMIIFNNTMVSINEKYFIENLACESAIKCLSPKKLASSEGCSSSDGNLKYQTQNNSKTNKFDDIDEIWDHPEEYLANWACGKSEKNLPRLSDGSVRSNSTPPKKRIVWNHQMIDSINNILSKSDLNSSSSSSSPEKKRCNIGNNSFHVDFNPRVEHYNKYSSDDSCCFTSPSSSKERNLYHSGRINKRRYSPRNDDKAIFKKSDAKNYRIPPLDANWKYENVEYVAIVSKIEQRMIRIKEWVRNIRPKISLIGDSHTRHLADIIAEMLPGFKIEASVKPGAKSWKVLSELKGVLRKMGKNDFVVTLSGTNDMWSESLDEPKSVVYNAVMDARCTNLLLCNVPTNYMGPKKSPAQDNITNFNQFYQEVVNFSKVAHLVDLNKLSNRNYFTRHGLHFNLHGKIKICELVSNKILDIIDLIKT